MKKTKKHKHKWQYVEKTRECIGHDFVSSSSYGISTCAQLSYSDKYKTGGHKDYFLYVCECGGEKEVETKESKKAWRELKS